MSKLLRSIMISATIWLCSGVGTAVAGPFEGQTINYQYYFPNLTIPYASAENGNYLVNSGIEISNVVDGYGAIDFSGDGFVVSFTNDSSFSSATFNGFVVSDILSTIDSFTSFNLVANTGVLGTPILNFDENNLYVNWQGLNFGRGDLIFTVNTDNFINPIPEPEIHAMLIVGFGLIGYTVRRRKIIS